MKLEHRRARVSGGEVSYLDVGDGPAVVLLHGFPTSSFLWRREALLLSARMRVIAPDLLGYGRSEKPADADLTMRGQAGYVRELLDHLGIAEFAAVGHEFGGGVAQLLALDGDVPVIVLLDSVCFDAWPSDIVTPLQSATEEEQTRQSAERFVRQILERGVSRRERLDAAAEESYLEPWQEDPRSLFRAARALDGTDLAGRERGLAQLELSAFILWGEDDPFLPSELAERLGESLPGSTVALLPGCSHFVNEDAPQTVPPLIHEFLRLRFLGESHGYIDARHTPVYLERPPPEAHLDLPDEEP